MAGCNYDELAKGPNSNNSNNNSNSNIDNNNTTNNNNNSNNNNNDNNNNNNNNNNSNNNNTTSSQICFRVSSGRDFTVGFEPSQTLCDILSRTIYDSKNFWITYNSKELLWYFPLSEQGINLTSNLIECKIHARSPKGKKYYDNSCSGMSGFESFCDSDSSVFSEPSNNGCLDCQNEDFAVCATYGCFEGSLMNERVNKRLIYDNPTDPLYQKRLHKREYQRKRYANMSLTARQLRLEQMRAYERARRASETLAEREARLMRLRINQKRRLDNETEAERLRRLQRLQRNQRLRLEIETPEERQKRLIRLRDNARLRIERKKAIAQILGMSRLGKVKPTPADLLLKQANPMSDREGSSFSCMKLSQKNSSDKDSGYQFLESANNKNITNRQDGFSYLNQSDKGVNEREDGFPYLSQNDKMVRQEDFYLDPNQKGAADRDGSYNFVKPQGENKDNSERRRSGFPCMGQVSCKEGANRVRSGGNTFTCMSTSGDNGFETSENGTISRLNSDQNKNDQELNFNCLTSQDRNKDVGDRVVGFPCLGQESGKNVVPERDGAFYSLGLADRDAGFPYLKPNYKPTQVDCVRSETMTPRSEDLLNLDAIQNSIMGSDKRVPKGSSSNSINVNSNLPLLNIDRQDKNINSSDPYSGLHDLEKGLKKRRKKAICNNNIMAEEEQGDHGDLEAKTDNNNIKKGEIGQNKKGPEASRGTSLATIIQQGCCAHFKAGSKRSMPPPNLNCCISDLNEYGAEMMSARDRKLLKMRLKQRWRMHNETEAQRAKRLLRMKRYQRQRMKDETAEQRQNRLVRMRENSKRRSQNKRALSQLFKSSSGQINPKKSSSNEMEMKHTKEIGNQKKYQYVPNDDNVFSSNISQRDRATSFMDSSSKTTSERQEMFQYLNMNEKNSCTDQDDGFSYLNLGAGGSGGEKTSRHNDFSYVDLSQKNVNERDTDFSCMKTNSNQGQIKENPEKGSVFPCMNQGFNKDVPERGCVFPGMDQLSNQDGINREGNSAGSVADEAGFPGLNQNQEERDSGYQCLTPNPDKQQVNRAAENFHYLNFNSSMDVCDKNEDFDYTKTTLQRRKYDTGIKKKSPDPCTGSSFASLMNQDCCEEVDKEGMSSELNEYIPKSALTRESQRQKRLEQMRQYQRRRLENETLEERQKRLQRMRDNARMRSEKKRQVTQMVRTAAVAAVAATSPSRKRLNSMDKDGNIMRYQSLSDHRDRDSNWSCMESNSKEKSEAFSSYLNTESKDHQQQQQQQQQQDDYSYLNTNAKTILNRDDDYTFIKANISQNQTKDNPERGSVFPCMDHVQNKDSPERAGVFPCMEEANNKDVERVRTGGPVFPCMTPALNKETPNKGTGVFSCIDQDQNKKTLDRSGSVSSINQSLTPTPHPTHNSVKDSTLNNRGATFQQYMLQSQNKNMIERNINNNNNANNNNNGGNNNNNSHALSGNNAMIFPFLNTTQNRNIPDREMGGYPCSLTPDQSNRVGSFSYSNMCHGLGMTERDGSYAYIKQTQDIRKKYAESAHRKKASEIPMGSAFASINKSDGGAGNTTMVGYPKSEQNYMCVSCERPLPKDQLSRLTAFPISMMPGSGPHKLCHDKQWICKTCEKLKRNYHLFPNPVS